jgi:large subunit ribosomal protein L25
MAQDQISLTLAPREVTGKKVKNLRADGQVPAVIHNHGKASVVVAGEYVAMLKTYQQAGRHHPVALTSGSQHFTAMIKSAEFDPKKHILRHVVFNAVKANQKVTAEIPIQPTYAEGNEVSPAERAGLMVLGSADVLEVEALPKDLPDALTYDAEKLVEVGDHITVADLQVPDGVTVQAEDTQTIASVYEPSAVAAANEDAGGDAEAEDQSDVPATEESEEAQENPDAGETPPKQDEG